MHAPSQGFRAPQATKRNARKLYSSEYGEGEDDGGGEEPLARTGSNSPAKVRRKSAACSSHYRGVSRCEPSGRQRVWRARPVCTPVFIVDCVHGAAPARHGASARALAVAAAIVVRDIARRDTALGAATP